jgi:hypothetical protein
MTRVQRRYGFGGVGWVIVVSAVLQTLVNGRVADASEVRQTRWYAIGWYRPLMVDGDPLIMF